MENINVTMGIDNEALEKLAVKIIESIDIEDHIDMVQIVDDRIEAYDFGDMIIDMTRVVDDRIEAYDFDSVIENFSFNSIVTDVIDDYDFDSLMTDFLGNNESERDIGDEVTQLLKDYSPANGCGIGEYFTEAICNGVRYLLLKDEDFVEHIAKALKKFEKKQMMEEIRESVKEELKPLMFDSFKAELERYAARVKYEEAQQLITQTNAVVISEVTPWTRENDIGY